MNRTIADIIESMPPHSFVRRSSYAKGHVKELIGDGKDITLDAICDLDILASDRVWLLASISPDPVREAASNAIVTRVVEQRSLHCGIPKIEQWAAQWLSGEDRTSKTAWAIVVSTPEEEEKIWMPVVAAAMSSPAEKAICATEVALMESTEALIRELGLHIEDYRAALKEIKH